MKKKVIVTSFFAFIFASVILLSSCGDDIYTDREIADKNIEKVTDALENRDRDAIKKLFAINVLDEVDSEINSSIDELLAYYEGEYISYKHKGMSSSRDNHYGEVKNRINASFDVTTTNTVYSIRITIYSEYTKEIDNEGIWTICILKSEDDPWGKVGYTYWGGNNSDNLGIHIGEISTFTVDEKLEGLLEPIQNKNKKAIRDLFAQDKISDIESFDIDLDRLLEYYNDKYKSYNNILLDVTRIDYKNDGDDIRKEYCNISYDIETFAGDYRIYIVWHLNWRDDNGIYIDDQIGIWSLYIIKAEDDLTPKHPYVGDGLDTLGINIGKVKESE